MTETETETVLRLAAVLGVAVLAYAITRWWILPVVNRTVRRTPTRWDDILANRKVRNRLAWIAPLLVIRIGVDPVLPETDVEGWVDLIERLSGAVLLLVALLVIGAVVEAVDEIYSQLDQAATRPIKGYLQIGMILVWIVGVIVVIALLADQNVGVLLGGIGAFSAVGILVFQDTILSLVAAVQLTNNDMLRVGDWIEMPSQNADGDVIEIALHTIKVQNWDKTITTIPTYKLISDSFKNWRGMSDSGGRRIMRSLLIDTSTVRFLTAEEIDQWGRFAPLARYVDAKTGELAEWNSDHAPDEDLVGDPRRLTNLGTFRAYVEAYLRAHPRLATDTMTTLVRQLQPTERGLPLELYVFTNTTAWEEYESIQADLFDHLLAVVPEFGLSIHEAPTGASITALSQAPR